jgi:hypothetical protein
MGQAAQRGLDPAGDDGTPGKAFAGALAVGQRGAVGPQADAAAGEVGVVVADLLVGGVVVDHRVHVPGADGEEQARPAELPPRLARTPIGLAEHGDAKPGLLPAHGARIAIAKLGWSMYASPVTKTTANGAAYRSFQSGRGSRPVNRAGRDEFGGEVGIRYQSRENGRAG